MNREDARLDFKNSGLTYACIDKNSLQRLRSLINKEMVKGGYMDGTLRCKQRGSIRFSAWKKYAKIRCTSYYFKDREVVSFNPNGFVGFAGWADDKHVMPVLIGFGLWVDELELSRPITY